MSVNSDMGRAWDRLWDIVNGPEILCEFVDRPLIEFSSIDKNAVTLIGQGKNSRHWREWREKRLELVYFKRTWCIKETIFSLNRGLEPEPRT